MRKLIFPPDTLVKFPSVMGDGSDGTVIISANTDLARDMYYENLTINSGIILNTKGFRIYVRGTTINKGTISNSGVSASGVTGGSGAPAGTLPSSGDGGDAGSGNYSDGKMGGSVINSLGGSGGYGDIGGFSNGGAPGSVVAPTSTFGNVKDFISAISGKTSGQPFIKGHIRLDKTANENFSNNLWASITYSSATIDDGAIVKFTASDSNYIVKRTGLYLLKLHTVFVANATGLRGTMIKLNGSDVVGGGTVVSTTPTGVATVDFSIVLKLSLNDKLNFLAYQSSGATLAITGATADITRSFVSISLLSDDSVSFVGGSGGGGAGGRDFVTAGGGGGGGGTLLLASNILDNTDGSIEALGGSGADGVGVNAPGGGGGGGGLVILVYSTLSDGNISVAGGSGGLNGDGGASGEDGAVGQIIKVKAL